jgi:hypothetical protein
MGALNSVGSMAAFRKMYVGIPIAEFGERYPLYAKFLGSVSRIW